MFRIGTCVGLSALLVARIMRAPSPKLFLFLVLLLLWFAITLVWGGAQRRMRLMLRHDAVFAAVEGFLVLVIAALSLPGSWPLYLLLLGVYVFLAGLTGGVLPGAAAAIATFFGLLNGWLLPANQLHGPLVLLAASTALMALACGICWRWGWPVLARMMRRPAGNEFPVADPAQPIEERIAAVEIRLRDVSAERDRAQEQLSAWEARQAAGGAGSPLEEKPAPEPAHSATNLPVTDDPALQSRLEQVAAALADSRAERAALLTEKQKLMSEIADLDKELTAVKASAAEAAGTSA